MAQPNDGGPARPEDVVPQWTRALARWEELYGKLNGGSRLTASEYEELYRLDRDLETLRTSRPEVYNNASAALDAFDKAGQDTSKAAPGSLLSSLSSTFSEKSNISRRAQTEQTTVRYVDLPTPDEFLDDFENAYNIHITGLVQTGAINPAVAQFARENMNEVFGEYLREQTARLLKGEPLWRVVGTNADNKLVGTRTGEFVDEATASETDKTFSSTETGSAVNEATAAAQAAAKAAGAQSEAGTAVQSTSGTSREDFYNRERLTQQEALVSRNRLGYVASLAPLDFLKNQATSQRLNLLYGGFKGARTREQQTSAGQTTVQARRI